MPVVPVYQAKEQLDPDTRGLPRVALSGADAAADYAQGQAVQGLGNQAASLVQHIEQKQEQQNKFDAGVQDDARRQEMAAAFTEAQNNAPVNGVGFHDSVLPKLDEIAEKRFAAMDPTQAERYRAQYQAERVGWQTKLAETERGIGSKYQAEQISLAQENALGEINANASDPAAVDAVRSRVQDRINDAAYLTTIQKAELSKAWSSNALAIEAAKRFKEDPVGAAKAMGIPLAAGTAASPDAVFGRMLNLETNGDARAVSPKGALGLAQLMPDTARGVAKDMGRPDVAAMSDTQLREFFANNPDVNKQMGRTYFGQMLARYNGDQAAAVVAYNAGPTKADEWIKAGKNDNVLPAETRNYKDATVGNSAGVVTASIRAGSPLGSVSFDGTKASVNGTTFSEATSPEAVARKFEGMNERDHRAALAAFIEKACGQKIDPAKIPWCAAFTDAVLGASGRPTLGSARAADFLNYGTPTNAPSRGDVVVFKSMAAGSSGHVGFVVGIEGDRVRYIAGNDGNKVQEDTLPLDKVAGFRVPPPAGDGAPDPRYVGLDFATRQKVVFNAEKADAQAQQQAKQQTQAEQYAVTKAVDDDVASLRSTGTGMDGLTPERVSRVLGPGKLQQWQDQRSYAQEVFKGTQGMETMPAEDIQNRIDQYRPTPEQAGPGFANRSAVFKEVSAKAEEVLSKRFADPAAAVAQTDPVRNAQTRLGTDKSPQAYEALVDARFAAQDMMGIPKFAQRAIPLDEAKQYASMMRPLARGQADAANQDQIIEGVVNDIQSKYGAHAKDVLQNVLYQVTLKRDASEVLATALTRMTKTDSGPVVTTEEVRKVETESWADSFKRWTGGGASAAEAQPYAGPNYENTGATVRLMPNTTSSDPAGGGRQPFTKAIEVLARDPDKNLQPFIAKFGIDRVPAYLRKKADELTKTPEPTPPPAYKVTRDDQGRVAGFAPQ